MASLPESKRRRTRPDKFSEHPQATNREEELYQLAVANSRLETQRVTQKEYPIPAAPTYRPTLAEFLDPLAYIEAIRAEVRARADGRPVAGDAPLS